MFLIGKRSFLFNSLFKFIECLSFVKNLELELCVICNSLIYFLSSSHYQTNVLLIGVS